MPSYPDYPVDGDVYSSYIRLLSDFLNEHMSALEFQHAYLGKFKMETERLDDTSFDLLDRLFGDVDAYTSAQELLNENPSHYLDETCLRTRVEQTLKDLRGMR